MEKKEAFKKIYDILNKLEEETIKFDKEFPDSDDFIVSQEVRNLINETRESLSEDEKIP